MRHFLALLLLLVAMGAHAAGNLASIDQVDPLAASPALESDANPADTERNKFTLNLNEAALASPDAVVLLPAMDASNRSVIYQDGLHHQALTEQRGADNAIVLQQHGANNEAALLQAGDRNSLGIVQSGNSSLHWEQHGNGNGGLGYMHGGQIHIIQQAPGAAP